jgi:hypothetical protein
VLGVGGLFIDKKQSAKSSAADNVFVERLIFISSRHVGVFYRMDAHADRKNLARREIVELVENDETLGAYRDMLRGFVSADRGQHSLC